MMEKLLFKRCSTEVQLMITRMKERPEDFNYGTTWRSLAESASELQFPYTWAERVAIRKQWKKTLQQRKRSELLGRIMNETINPSSKESLEDGMESYKRQQRYMQAHVQAQIKAGAFNTLAGYNDPRALYQQGHQSQLQGRIQP